MTALPDCCTDISQLWSGVKLRAQGVLTCELHTLKIRRVGDVDCELARRCDLEKLISSRATLCRGEKLVGGQITSLHLVIVRRLGLIRAEQSSTDLWQVNSEVREGL